MPPKHEGLRRLPGQKGKFFIGAFRQWLVSQSVTRKIGMGVALYLAVALSAYAVFGNNACAVTVAGKTVAVAADEKTAKRALGELIQNKSDLAGRKVAVQEKVSYRGVKVAKEEIMDAEALKGSLSETLTFSVKATALLVDGQAKVFLNKKEDAQTILDWLKTLYPVQEGEQPAFKEKIQIAEAPADADSILELEDAKKLVLLGTNKVQQYTVKDGDNLWDISRAQKVDMDQVILSNPGLDPERLQIGQALNLSKESPLITVMAVREVTLNEAIPCPVEVKTDDKLLLGEKKVIKKGVPGERIVTYRITRENGLETSREVLAESIVREPATEVVARGTYTMVASRGGSIRLGWPCSGGIISPYGMRGGRMHEGVDIGAGYGSPVAATAGGTVVSAGWHGGYGNCVDISHGGGLVTRYAHLSSIKVKVDQSVERGQLIGLVGATGWASGPHLHYEVHVNGSPRNPVNYLP